MKTKLLIPALFLGALMQAQTYTNAVAAVISDATNVTGNCGNATSPGSGTSTINVPLVATITNPANVTINLNLTHTWLADVVAELVTPGGTSCALIKRIGAGTDAACGSGSDLLGTNTLSFNTANATAVPAATSPVPAGNYMPTSGIATYPAAVPLCNLATFLNGVAVNGDWVLNVSDNGVGDLGQITSWSLVFNILGQQEFIFTNAIAVLGNPFQNELVLKVNNPAAQSAVFNLYSMDGKRVHQSSFTALNVSENITLNTATLEQGIYLLVAEVDGIRQNGIRLIRN